MDLLVHICRPADWAKCAKSDAYEGTATDKADGFIHMSPPELAEESANLYFADAEHIKVVWIDPSSIQTLIKYEPSSRGVDFPHLYGALPHTAVARVDDIHRGTDGQFQIDLAAAPA